MKLVPPLFFDTIVLQILGRNDGWKKIQVPHCDSIFTLGLLHRARYVHSLCSLSPLLVRKLRSRFWSELQKTNNRYLAERAQEFDFVLRVAARGRVLCIDFSGYLMRIATFLSDFQFSRVQLLWFRRDPESSAGPVVPHTKVSRKSHFGNSRMQDVYRERARA